MNKEFEEWAKVNHCLTDSAWKAWQAAWGRGLTLGREEAAEMATRRVRNTELLDGGSHEELREAIALRVADCGKQTAFYKDGGIGHDLAI